MRTLYIDCPMGAAGDMLTGALLELIPSPDKFIEKMNNIGLKGIAVSKKESEKCGIKGTHISVNVNGKIETEHMFDTGEQDEDNPSFKKFEPEHHHHHHHHHHSHSDYHHHDEHHHGEHHHEEYHQSESLHEHSHSSLDEIKETIRKLDIPENVKKDIIEVYVLIAEAESKAHGKPVSEIHFHEVGTMDAIADITAVCLLINEIGADKIVVSPIHVGSGTVRCAHGILPVPAPATAYILKGCPIYGGKINGELCTPTGAALLRHFASSFGDMPRMNVSSVGYGMGSKDFEIANCVRASLGESIDISDSVSEYVFTVDDMTAEDIGYSIEALLENGALDVYAVPAVMKKSRPGHEIHVICKSEDSGKLIQLIFKFTSTIGIREIVSRRYVLDRHIEEVETKYGKIHVKVSSGYGVRKVKPEYDDILKITKEKNLSPEEIRKEIE